MITIINHSFYLKKTYLIRSFFDLLFGEEKVKIITIIIMKWNQIKLMNQYILHNFFYFIILITIWPFKL